VNNEINTEQISKLYEIQSYLAGCGDVVSNYYWELLNEVIEELTENE